jgi:hypothetical protein
VVDHLADHITDFSLAALKHLPDAKARKSKPSPAANGKH